MRNPKAIAMRYMTGIWFFLDFVAAVPLSAIFEMVKAIEGATDVEGQDGAGGLAKLNHIPRILKISKLLRLLRVFKLTSLTRRLEESGVLKVVSPPVLRLIRYPFILLFMWHWMGCLWLFIYQREEADGEIGPDNSWGPPNYWADIEGDDFHRWLYAIYWGLVASGVIG